jgi:hypothetical protein
MVVKGLIQGVVARGAEPVQLLQLLGVTSEVVGGIAVIFVRDCKTMRNTHPTTLLAQSLLEHNGGVAQNQRYYLGRCQPSEPDCQYSR